MGMSNVVLVYPSLLFVFKLISAEQCTFFQPCICSTSSYNISLLPLMVLRHDTSFKFVDSVKNYDYFLQPCNRIADECDSDQTACQVEKTVPVAAKRGLGQINGNSAETADTSNFVLKNTYGIGTEIRTSLLKIVCSSKQDEFIFEKEDPLQTYHFILNTYFACPPSKSSSGLSVGSILVILFFVFILVYLIGGVLFLKYVRKAQGAEVIPNVEFWKELPSLIKDGVLFTCRGCKAETTYEKI